MAIEYFANCINEAELSHIEKKKYIKLLKPYLPKNLPDSEQWSEYYQAKELLLTQLYLLDSLNHEKEFYELVKKYYRQEEEFCLSYIERLEKDNRCKAAIKIAEEGLGLFPEHMLIDR